MSCLLFKHPEPSRPKTRIWPVFMPFMGCPSRCVYCSQERQTGTGAKGLNKIYQAITEDIPAFFSNSNRKPLELAFFGGTFTALPMEWQQRFLSAAKKHKENGFITKIRCSTRPDFIEFDNLTKLAESGMDMLELGIQSFSAHTLKRSGRNYSPETALKACKTVKKAGLSLGVQLLPGLPGSAKGEFQNDIDRTISIQPDAVRIYPCLTVKGTALEKLYNAGKYKPWSLPRTEEELSFALLRLWNKKIHVIRLGVASEDGFQDNIVAGPVHPALGQLVRSKALYLFIRSRLPLLNSEVKQVVVPSKYSGEFWGHKGTLKPLYSRLNITPDKVRFSKGRQFELHS
ncbi:elongator complex protein 3 [Maridesulfovibrio ferrireducens]|uniref:elongator complex protein 3 n=1 Tax=Maridesulfovibrio ferrireducens TaxID=246191 RepID=UPI001A357B75|nr:radical SAM protein [Maridesulfovibrio ferrireducens]MBI9111115.1 radical SAM protein [Maridesulfovibrio ferrireducens]